MGQSLACFRDPAEVPSTQTTQPQPGANVGTPLQNLQNQPLQKQPSPQPLKPELYEPGGAEAYELIEDLGSPNGEVHLKVMRNKRTGQLVSVKFVTKTPKDPIPRGVEREIVNHRRLVHPNIVRFYEVFVVDDNLGVVSEYPAGGCLADHIAAKGPLQENQAKSLFLQLLAGMQYCHDTKIYHRDLRVQNMYLDLSDGAPRLKISDFSYSKSVVYDSNPKTKVITAPLNTPPELLKGTNNIQNAYDGSKVDIWGAGIILYVMLTGAQPFQDPTHPGIMNQMALRKIVQCAFSFPLEARLTNECKDFISKIFVAEPNERMSIADMHKHPWLTGVRASVSTGRSIESKQNEDEITGIVERARKRRENRPAQENSPYRANSGVRKSSGSQKPSVRPLAATTKPTSIEYGIAEIPMARV